MTHPDYDYELRPTDPELEFTTCRNCGSRLFLIEPGAFPIRQRWGCVEVFEGRVQAPLGPLATRMSCEYGPFWWTHEPDVRMGLLGILAKLRDLACK